MSLEINKAYLGDCLEVMKNIPDKSIDMILCDLPYGTTACKWDVIIPFDKLWEQYNRIAKDNTAIVLFGCEPFSSRLRMSNISYFKYDWIWYKNMVTGLMLAKRQPLRKYEIISVFYKKQCVYNRQMIKRTDKEFKECYRVNDSIDTKSDHYVSKKIRQDKERQWYKPPVNIIEFDIDRKRDGKQHPTQKPILLLEYLIKTYTNEGNLVLDNCAGSGTTGIACKNLNRNFILIEKEEKYFNIIQERLNSNEKLLEVKEDNEKQMELKFNE